MGLDMYLSAKKYFSPYMKKDLHEKVNKAIKKLNIPGQGDMVIKRIECEAMYWRKANAIHKWFVDNIQDGVDDCKSYWVDIESLRELLDLCCEVLKDREKAAELLPPQEGFFFGGTEIGEYYFQDIENTIEGLTKLLEIPEINGWEFEYHSSW